MNVQQWKARNLLRKMARRVRYPPPLYRKVGGINAVVHRANGSKENLGKVSVAYAKRWGVSGGR